MQFPKRKAVHSTLGDAVLGAALRKGMTWSATAAALITLCSRHFRQKMLTPHNGTTAIARTRVLPQATPVGTLSAQFATSILAAGDGSFTSIPAGRNAQIVLKNSLDWGALR
jgi:hypothetical protein